MTSFRSTQSEPIVSKAQIIAVVANGAKPKECWRIGTEHEKFIYRRKDFGPLPYHGPVGIKVLLSSLARYGWESVNEGDTLVALKRPNGATVSLEPGEQLEFSGAQLDNVHENNAEIAEHLAQVRAVGGELGVGMLGIGFSPGWRRGDVHWMPKGRYSIMRGYMPHVGSHGLDMMLRTCSVQVNLVPRSVSKTTLSCAAPIVGRRSNWTCCRLSGLDCFTTP